MLEEVVILGRLRIGKRTVCYIPMPLARQDDTHQPAPALAETPPLPGSAPSSRGQGHLLTTSTRGAPTAELSTQLCHLGQDQPPKNRSTEQRRSSKSQCLSIRCSRRPQQTELETDLRHQCLINRVYRRHKACQRNPPHRH